MKTRASASVTPVKEEKSKNPPKNKQKPSKKIIAKPSKQKPKKKAKNPSQAAKNKEQNRKARNTRLGSKTKKIPSKNIKKKPSIEIELEIEPKTPIKDESNKKNAKKMIEIESETKTPTQNKSGGKKSNRKKPTIELESEPKTPTQNKSNRKNDPLSKVMTLEAEVSNNLLELENQKTFLEADINMNNYPQNQKEKPQESFLIHNTISNQSLMPGLESDLSNNNLNPDRKFIKIKTSQFINEKQGKFMDDYKIIKEIGSGSFGKVYKVEHLKFTERVFAMKMIKKRSSDDVSLIEQEINSLKRLDHPNIMKVLEFYQDAQNYYLILEYCEGQELFDYLINKGTFNEKNACFIMKQLLSSVSHAHKHNIVHRDLKPENIMIQGSDLNIKIIDWGFATIFNSQETLKDNYGTAFYVAPEVLLKRYTEKCDIWSCGVILYIMLIGSPPITYSLNGLREAQRIHKNQNIEFLRDDLICKKLVSGNYDLKIDCYKELSKEVKDLLNKMLNRTTTQRPSALEALSHPWFAMFDTSKTDQNLIKNLENTLINLKGFRADQKLLQAVLAYMAYQGTLKEDEGRLKSVFKELDLNGDGELQREEIVYGYRKIMGEKQAEEEVDKIMEALDIDHNNSISYTEFILATMNKKKVITEERIKEAFDMFDENKNGSISLDEIKKGRKIVLFLKNFFWKKILNF